VLLNLLGNATKFTDRDGSVRLRVRSDGAAQPRIEFAVEDTGSGIPQDKLEHIFEPFYRVADSTRSVEGTGLGLAITRKLVGAMSGSIDVASRVGEGSTFTVTIPFEATRCDESLKSRADKILGYAGARRTIVIADDDEANRMLVSSLLESLGFIVKRACNGLEALQLCRASPVDLVVTDLVMPVVDGIELTGAIRGASATPIVALSASASSHTQREALQTGCNVFLTKPVNLQLLLGEIGRLLELEWRRSGADEVASAVQSRETMETDPKVARELYHFAQQGDINALLSRAEAALASNPGSQPFYVKIRTLAEQYDMGALRRMLAQQCNAP
jgi:CheY-like chemotaxis protein